MTETNSEQVANTSAKLQEKTIPKWEVDARLQIKTGLKALKKPLADLISRDAVEADTRLYITDFMERVLGYDKYANLTAEYQVKGDWADYGVRIDGNLIAFIEAKRVNQQLSDKHLKQVQAYAVNEGVDWLILTNARQWQVYHIKAEGLPLQTDLVIDVDLIETSPKEVESALFYLHCASMKKKVILDVWKRVEATSEPKVLKALMSPSVVKEIRLTLTKQTGFKVTDTEVTDALKNLIQGS
jgi:predicted type IV restriction endonuclease